MKDKNIITIGWHKGELDFGISGEILSLDLEQMNKLREMIVVAIGTAENMWRREREKLHSAKSNSQSDKIKE